MVVPMCKVVDGTAVGEECRVKVGRCTYSGAHILAIGMCITWYSLASHFRKGGKGSGDLPYSGLSTTLWSAAQSQCSIRSHDC